MRNSDLEPTLLRLMVKELSDAVEAYIEAFERGVRVNDDLKATEEQATEAYRVLLRASLRVCGQGHILVCGMSSKIVESAPKDKESKLVALIERACRRAHEWVGKEEDKLQASGVWAVHESRSKDVN